MQILLSENWEKYTQSLAEAQKRWPELRVEALTKIGQQLLDEVQQKIGGSGRVAGWQQGVVGSKGYYTAVHAMPKTYEQTKSGRRYAVGAITNAITSGHKTRLPSGKAKRYEPRIKTHYVPGKQFYAQVNAQAEAIAMGYVDEMLDKMVDILEGNT